MKLLFHHLSVMGSACTAVCNFICLTHFFFFSFIIIHRLKRFIQHVLWWLSIWRLKSNAFTHKDKRPTTATISQVSSPIWTTSFLTTLHLFMSLISTHSLIGNKTLFEVNMIYKNLRLRVFLIGWRAEN